MRLRVGLVSEWYDPETGAAAVPGVVARSLASRGVDLKVLTGIPSYPHGKFYPGYGFRSVGTASVSDIPITRVPIIPNHNDSVLGRSAMWVSYAIGGSIMAPITLRDRDAVLVHMTPATAAAPAAVLKLLRGVPYVLHVEDLWPHTVLAARQMPAKGRILVEKMLNYMCDRLYRGADSIAVISPGMIDAIAARGIPRDKLSFAPNWADEDAFKPERPDPTLKQKLGIKRPFNVMYAGNLGQFQALPLLLDSAARLKARTDIGFVFVGDGVMRSQMEKRVASEGFDSVVFLDPRPASEMSRILALGDIHYIGLADNPLFDMTLPSKLQGTMASGGAIVGPLSGDPASIVRESGAGIVIDDKSAASLSAAIEQFADSPQLVARSRSKSLEFYRSRLCENVGSNILIDLLTRAACRSTEDASHSIRR